VESQTIAKAFVPDRSIAELVKPVLGEQPLQVQSRHVGGEIYMEGSPQAPRFSVKGYIDRPTISGQADSRR